MSIVSNTGPLIALAKVNRLGVLEKLFGIVQIPPAVQRELFAGSTIESARLDEALARLIRVQTVEHIPPEVKAATEHLGIGEQQAIALAYQSQLPLIIDDRAGRTVARGLGISVTGLVGTLILAKQAGLIQNVRALLEEIRTRGYWLSDDLIEQAERLAGETK
jgi:predicted nucleic acid-binding protein